MRSDPKVLVIRTDFRHHGDNFGYKQILKFIKPIKILGVNERSEQKISLLKKKYQWLFEFEAFTKRKGIDLVHILYGEDYYRWSAFLFRKIPVVATFHQPPEILEREVLKGDVRGRIGRITHTLTTSRFKKLSAAIVTNPSQKRVLEKVMSSDRIHYIPLGIYIDVLNAKFRDIIVPKTGKWKVNIITVGNWMRDWDFYILVIERCPDFHFHLVDRKISRELLDRISRLENVSYYPDLPDEELFELYKSADMQFLPVLGIAGSNAFLQGLALGCPTLVTGFDNDPEENYDFIRHYRRNDVTDCIDKMKAIADLPENEKTQLRKMANQYANQFSWESVAARTKELYRKLINKEH